MLPAAHIPPDLPLAYTPHGFNCSPERQAMLLEYWQFLADAFGIDSFNAELWGQYSNGTEVLAAFTGIRDILLDPNTAPHLNPSFALGFLIKLESDLRSVCGVRLC